MPAQTYELIQLDVFTQTPLAGNPLAIFPDAQGLTDDQMQALAQSFHDIAVEIGQVRLNAITAGSKLTDPGIIHYVFCVSSLLKTQANFAELQQTILQFFRQLGAAHPHLRHL